MSEMGMLQQLHHQRSWQGRTSGNRFRIEVGRQRFFLRLRRVFLIACGLLTQRLGKQKE